MRDRVAHGSSHACSPRLTTAASPSRIGHRAPARGGELWWVVDGRQGPRARDHRANQAGGDQLSGRRRRCAARVIAYFDTSMLVKLLVDDDAYRMEAERIWLGAEHLVCAEVGHVETRAALAAARRGGRLEEVGMRIAKDQSEALWEQINVIPVDTALVRAAGDIAEIDGLRGYDAVHLATAVAVRATVAASADRQLIGAARNRGFGLVHPRWLTRRRSM